MNGIVVLFLGALSFAAADRLYRTYDFSSRDKVNAEWDVLRWGARARNNELQRYTDSQEYVYTQNNQLVIRAKKDRNGAITSGRLHSKEKFSPLNFGTKKMRVEFRATVPAVEGAWPALWMNGASETYGRWPKTGEIDVMEWVWGIQKKTISSLHWKSGYDTGQDNRVYPGGLKDISGVHTYRVDVSAIPGNEYVQFSVDDHWHPEIRADKWVNTFHPDRRCHGPEAKRCTKLAPFDNQMTLILNVAVGGDWGGSGVGNYNAFNGNGVTMNVHSVKVYELSP